MPNLLFAWNLRKWGIWESRFRRVKVIFACDAEMIVVAGGGQDYHNLDLDNDGLFASSFLFLWCGRSRKKAGDPFRFGFAKANLAGK